MRTDTASIVMPAVTNLNRIRALLNRDRWWAAYAIADLDPPHNANCEWHAPADHTPALVLVYRGFTPPITFAMGDPSALRALFAEITAREISLHLRPDAITALPPVYTPTFTRPMKRMALRPDAFQPAAAADVREIGEEHLPAVEALYDDGRQTGERPTFFHPAMLRQGTFRGIWENARLVSIAGTHLHSTAEGVCAIGNIYTRRDRRGHGLAARVTSAVVAHALGKGIPTIVLNVGHANSGAQRVYERLGFEHYCDFLEGAAVRGEVEGAE
jgi:GNAT superfamily N-acetyltransferase